MTAIFAYVDTKRGVAFVGADDRETPVSGAKDATPMRCDKVVVLQDRFIVASLGSVSAGTAARAVGYLAGLPTEFGDGTQFTDKINIEWFCDVVASILARSVGHRDWESLNKEGQLAGIMDSKLVIVDAVTFELALADFGKMGARGTRYRAKIRNDFEQNYLWRFGVGAPVAIGHGAASVTALEWCEEAIRGAQQDAKDRGKPDAVGDFGAWASWENGRMTIRTIHSSLPEVMTALFGKLP
jgi:hypothetical protein